MEHDEAIRCRAAERYVAQELTAEEQAGFEEHFFDCPTCAKAVRCELTFNANMRAALRQPLAHTAAAIAPSQRVPPMWRRCRDWLRARPALALSYGANVAWAAAVALLLLTGARNGVQPRLMGAYFAPGSARGAGDVHELARGSAVYLVRFPRTASTAYSYEILDVAGKRESAASLQAPAAGDEDLYLEVPVKGLSAGIHTLEVHGGGPTGEIISRSRFQISR